MTGQFTGMPPASADGLPPRGDRHKRAGAAGGKSPAEAAPRKPEGGSDRGNKPSVGGRFFRAVRANAFVLLLLAGFLTLDAALAAWDPMTNSERFYKEDFTKTINHHGGSTSGKLFFGNSAVAGAYIEEQAEIPLVEMGLSYGKLTDLKEILKQELYTPRDLLVIGIDEHTMLDELPTDPVYPWFRKWYQPYLYFYRDYFLDSGKEWVRNFWNGLREGRLDVSSYEPRWADKMVYYGHLDEAELRKRWEKYEKEFGRYTVEDGLDDNIAALEWVLQEAGRRDLPVSVIWMPVNPDPRFPPQSYWEPLRRTVNAMLHRYGVPVLDLSSKFPKEDFHDLVHLERTTGAPKFTKEVDAWLRSPASSSKPSST